MSTSVCIISRGWRVDLRLVIFALSSRAATSQIGYRWYPVKLFNFDAKHKEKLLIKNKEVISSRPISPITPLFLHFQNQRDSGLTFDWLGYANFTRTKEILH